MLKAQRIISMHDKYDLQDAMRYENEPQSMCLVQDSQIQRTSKANKTNQSTAAPMPARDDHSGWPLLLTEAKPEIGLKAWMAQLFRVWCSLAWGSAAGARQSNKLSPQHGNACRSHLLSLCMMLWHTTQLLLTIDSANDQLNFPRQESFL